MELNEAIKKMLAGTCVRLNEDGKREWIKDKKMYKDETGKGWFYLLSLDANGTFRICSNSHQISNGYPPEFLKSK